MPNPRKSLLHKTFGQLKVMSYEGKNEHGLSLWLCHCQACGRDKIMPYSTLTYPKGHTKSCGCQRGARKKTTI